MAFICGLSFIGKKLQGVRGLCPPPETVQDHSYFWRRRLSLGQKWVSVWGNQKKWLHDLWIKFATLLQTLGELLGCFLGTPGVLPRWACGGSVAECQSLEVGSSGTFFFPFYSDWRNFKDSRERAKQTVNCFPSNLMMTKCVWTYDERTYICCTCRNEQWQWTSVAQNPWAVSGMAAATLLPESQRRWGYGCGE